MKGKLMMAYYQLRYFENNLDKVSEQLLNCTGIDPKNMNNSYHDPRPCFICASSYGYYYAQGFITQLISSFFLEEYDPCTIDSYRYNLEMDNSSKRMISMYPISLYEEYPILLDNHINMSDGMIFSLVIRNDFNPNNFTSEFAGFTPYYNQLAKSVFFNRYIITIAIHYKDIVEDSFKKIVEEELRKFLKQNYDFRNYLIMECNLFNREQVLRTTVESVKRFRFIDTNQFLKYMIQSDKKKCSLM
ncbi:predicted protein [Naegleria gruberi]|uniref:Predicted protein n=1 Tax=Naegleria gruberi TaxID=5762 RepID=D2VPJ1_NAEGR|nr:uncharacterized protein NAEGRDRAFT_70878 [Naegleria gruberi]EFC41132.1 predicted protein [Naegleria gruberi]|eukprot:XP_002673876.1 predicted protein [Naegleria gruberi strain NEG-M]